MYWRQNDKIYHVAAASVLDMMQSAGMPGWSWSSITSGVDLSPYTVGPEFIISDYRSDGLLLRQDGTSEVYVIQNGRRRWVKSADALNWMGGSWFPDVIEVPSSIISSYVLAVGNPVYGVGEGDPATRSAFQSAYTANANDSNCQEPSTWKGWPGDFSGCLEFPYVTVATATPSGAPGSSVTGKYQNFAAEQGQKGTINHSALGTFAVHGAIFTKYSELGYSGSALGFPKSNEYQWGAYRRSNFEGGYIYWDPNSDVTTVVYGASPPAAPTGLVVTGTTDNSVSLGWNDVSDESGYRLYKWIGSSFVLHTQLGPNVTTYTDSGLSCGSDYFYEVSAYNASGESGHSPWIMATTQACAPQAPTVTTQAATGVGQTGATLNATVNPNGSPTTAYFQHGTTTSYGSTTASSGMGSGTGIVPFSSSVAGLTCNIGYHFRAVATNTGGTSYGADTAFTTAACSATPTMQLVSPSGGESWPVGSIRAVTWTSSNLDPNGRIYLFYWDSGWQQFVDLPPSATSYNWTVPTTPIADTSIWVGNWVNGAWEAWDQSASFSITAGSDVIFQDGFESGDTSAWSSSVP